MALPLTIEPCPIIDASLEIRFSTQTHKNAVFGLIYNVLKDDFGTAQSLPILELPEAIRTQDLNFRYKPHYIMKKDGFVLQIGPEVISISSHPKYVGWENFSKKIYYILDKVDSVRIIDNVERLGIRYINFFKEDIFNNIRLKIYIGENTIQYKNTVFRTEFEHGSFNSTLQIRNNAQYQNQNGSFLDIDTFKDNELEGFFKKKETIIEEGHTQEKNLFYSLLKEDFLSKLKPIYENGN